MIVTLGKETIVHDDVLEIAGEYFKDAEIAKDVGVLGH